MSKQNFPTVSFSQTGAALILSMILLLVLTLLGLSSMRTATMEEKMASNMRDRNLAFEAAESALRKGEDWINQQTSESAISASEFSYGEGQLSIQSLQTDDWWSSNPSAVHNGFEGVHSDPRYVIEERAFVADSLVKGFAPTTGKNVYRVIARGTGATDTAQSITESTFAKRFN